jgi:hypothetical protein
MKRKFAVVAVSLICAFPVLAAPYAFNARQDAMGGAGVSSAHRLDLKN